MTVSTANERPRFDEDLVRSMLEHADPLTLRGLVYHATGDAELEDIEVVEVQWPFSTARSVTNPDDLSLIRRKALGLLRAYHDGTLHPPSAAPTSRLLKAVSLALDEHVAPNAMRMHLDMLALNPAPRGWGEPPNAGNPGDYPVVVIGAGLAGVNAAVQLKASGIPFVLLDKNAGAGGTWFQNTYPGARVDWPSVLYSHSYGIDFKFQYAYAPQVHNEEYINWCIDQYGVRPHMRFGVAVESLTWNEEESVWLVLSRDVDGAEKLYRAAAVITAIGLLERPFIPKIPGADLFDGKIFHTTRFDHSIDYSDKRVVVVGTGASGMQMVPELAEHTKHLTVFQRTPSWVFPAEGYRDTLPKELLWLNAHVPGYSHWTRLTLSWNLGDRGLYDQFLVDPDWTEPNSVNQTNYELRERLLVFLQQELGDRADLLEACQPKYPVFGSRPVIDNGWFEALKSDKVSLVTSGVVRFTPDGVVGANGVEVPADIVVLATGFTPNEYFSQIEVTGRDGVNINDIWAKDGPRAFWGVTVPKMPNLFIMYGPNANPSNLGPVQYGEWAMAYFLALFKTMIENGWTSFEVRQDAFDRFQEKLDDRLSRLVSVNPRAHKTYFTNEYGRSAVQSPWKSSEVCDFFAKPDLDDYLIGVASATAEREVA